MVQAKCSKCGGSGVADTFLQARKLINHAIGLSRGIKCGDNHNMVKEIKTNLTKNTKPEIQKPITPNINSEKLKEKTKQTKYSA